MSEFYKNITSIKKAGIVHNYTEEEVQEYVKCAKDISYFAEHYIKIKNLDRGIELIQLRPYQRKILEHYFNNRNSICLSSRQSGKCITKGTVLDLEIEDQQFKLSIDELFRFI